MGTACMAIPAPLNRVIEALCTAETTSKEEALLAKDPDGQCDE